MVNRSFVKTRVKYYFNKPSSHQIIRSGNMKKLVSILLISILSLSLLAACGTKSDSSDKATSGDKAEKKVLTMGTSADYAPYEYIDTEKGEEIIGFDVDLAKAVTKELGYELKIVDMDFNGLIPSIQSKKVDFVLAGMSPTPERKEVVDFSMVYYAAPQLIVTKKDSGIKKVEDLKGKTVGVQVSSIQEEKAVEIKKSIDINVENRGRIPEVVQELRTDRFDAIILEEPVTKGHMNANPDFISFEIPDPNNLGSAIVFAKNSELTKKVDAIIQEMIDNGEMDKLIEKWFSGDIEA
jgi:arginine/lysine/histidine transporter system substrate-binding protein